MRSSRDCTVARATLSTREASSTEDRGASVKNRTILASSPSTIIRLPNLRGTGKAKWRWSGTCPAQFASMVSHADAVVAATRR